MKHELPKTDGDWRRKEDGSLYDASKEAPPESDLKEDVVEENINDESSNPSHEEDVFFTGDTSNET